MSSTNRGSERSSQDYYYTPIQTIKDFWKVFIGKEGVSIDDFTEMLDTCAGGDKDRPCAYPEAISKEKFYTIDIREDSKAELIDDYLRTDHDGYGMIISNPPFNLFEKFVEKATNEVERNGYVIFLLRLNATGAQCRRLFWKKHKPKAIYVHSKRPSFMPGSGDSCEYAHFVWQKGYTRDTKFYWV